MSSCLHRSSSSVDVRGARPPTTRCAECHAQDAIALIGSKLGSANSHSPSRSTSLGRTRLVDPHRPPLTPHPSPMSRLKGVPSRVPLPRARCRWRPPWRSARQRPPPKHPSHHVSHRKSAESSRCDYAWEGLTHRARWIPCTLDAHPVHCGLVYLFSDSDDPCVAGHRRTGDCFHPPPPAPRRCSKMVISLMHPVCTL